MSKRGHKASSGKEEEVGFLKGNDNPLLPEKKQTADSSEPKNKEDKLNLKGGK
jgi:hypothetical protein